MLLCDVINFLECDVIRFYKLTHLNQNFFTVRKIKPTNMMKGLKTLLVLRIGIFVMMSTDVSLGLNCHRTCRI